MVFKLELPPVAGNAEIAQMTMPLKCALWISRMDGKVCVRGAQEGRARCHCRCRGNSCDGDSFGLNFTLSISFSMGHSEVKVNTQCEALLSALPVVDTVVMSK